MAHLWSDRTEEVRPGLQHGVLEVLAEEERVAAGDGHAGSEFLLDDRLGHFHEELGHFGQTEVDLLACESRVRERERGVENGGGYMGWCEREREQSD